MNILPQEGQIVAVRGEQWAVTEVKAQALPRSSADDGTAATQHAVGLQSIAEDRLGEELRVIWELEPGRQVLPDRGLPEVRPDRFDDPATLAAFVDALRWGAVTSADARTLQAPFRSGASVEAYQLEPVRRVLQASRANLLLADDVGLGKTVEAGLVIQELLLRHRARTVMVVCPAGLVLKWQDEMREKFGLEFQIVNSDTLREVRRTYGVHANPFTLFPRIIVSMSWLPGDRAQRLLHEVYAATEDGPQRRRGTFDVLVVDEAHHIAPSAPQRFDQGLDGGLRRGYAVDTKRTVAVRELAERCEHRLFLSATPHNGYTESLTALLEMVDDRRFARGAVLDKAALNEVVVRRLKRDLAEQRAFLPRRVETLTFAPTTSEHDAYRLLTGFIARRKRAVRGVSSERVTDLATLLLKKRFFSSPVAFARTVETYLATRGTETLDDVPDYAEVLGDDLEEGRVEQTESRALTGTRRALPAVSEADSSDLQRLADWGHDYRSRPDSRLEALLDFLAAVLKTSDGTWLNERIVIFTEYLDTLHWIRGVLEQHGFGGDRLAVISSEVDIDERELIRERFQASPAEQPVRILLATDAAGEGIDLQAHCHRLVNFDVPFNPNRLEQRIGRIDRYGQRHSPQVFHFVPEPTGRGGSGYEEDLGFLARIAVKIAQVQTDLGSVNPVIADDIQRMLAGTTRRGPAAGPQRMPATPAQDPVTTVLQGERQVGRHLTRLEEQLADSADSLRLRPANLERVVTTALRLDHQPELVEVGDADTDARVFRLPPLARSWEPVTRGLASRLEPDRLRCVTFDAEAARDRTDLVYAHLGHALVQRSTRLLRSALWADRPGINRVSAVVVDGLAESFVAAVTRLVLVGKGGLRLHEEVFLAGTRLNRSQALGIERAEKLLEQALDGARLTAAPEKTTADLAHRWDAETGPTSLRSRVEQAVRDRVDKRRDQVGDLLRHREQADLERVDAVFDRFADTLRRTLAEIDERDRQQRDQPVLFDLEQRQRERDIRRIRDRLEDLDSERRREREAVWRRYTDVVAYPFAAALVFALSPREVTP